MAGWIKYMRSEESKFLLSNPFANHLLQVIASRAKREDCPMTGLKAGESMIGDYAKIGLTRQQYRTATNNLQKYQLITIRATTKGTIAKLTDSRVYDINGNQANQQEPKKQPSSPQNLTTNKEVRSKKEEVKQEKLSKLNSSEFPEGLNLDCWKEWLSYRKTDLKKPFKTARSEKTAVNKFVRECPEPEDQKASVESSISNGYQGLFAVKPGSDSRRKSDGNQAIRDFMLPLTGEEASTELLRIDHE